MFTIKSKFGKYLAIMTALRLTALLVSGCGKLNPVRPVVPQVATNHSTSVLGDVGPVVSQNAAAPHAGNQPVGQRPSFTTLENGLYGVWAKPMLVVAGSPCEWVGAMNESADREALLILPPPSAPDIDWSRQTAVLVALGRADGYTVEVRSVSRVGHTLSVDVHVEMGQRSGGVDISPYHLIVVDAKSVDTVEARYDWAPPGLPTSATAAQCISDDGLKKDRGTVIEDAAPTEITR